jgi:hypothetical protein
MKRTRSNQGNPTLQIHGIQLSENQPSYRWTEGGVATLKTMRVSGMNDGRRCI